MKKHHLLIGVSVLAILALAISISLSGPKSPNPAPVTIIGVEQPMEEDAALEAAVDDLEDNGYDVSRWGSKEEMVSTVLGQLGEGDCIQNLYLIGHGSPGNISAGDGKGHEHCKHINGDPTDWQDALAPLQGKFCEGAKLHLIGCEVGKGDAGTDKLQALANFLGVTVTAPTVTVKGGDVSDWIE